MRRDAPVILEFNKVDFSYGPVQVLEGASFHIHAGEFVALVGPNGAGKSTILKLILALENPNKGNITLFGSSPHASREKIGYVPQLITYDPAFPISVEEVVRIGRIAPFARRYTPEDQQAVEQALEQMDLSDLAKRPYRALSGGQRRRVLVARALSANPKMLILDEPTSNMDVESEQRLFSALGDLKGETTILIVTHDTSFVSSLTDRALCVGEFGPQKMGRKVVQHEVVAIDDDSLKVLHNTTLSHECGYLKEPTNG